MEKLKPSDLLLMLLYTPEVDNYPNNSGIEGVTRLTKLLFILQNELEKSGLSFEKFEYKPFKMGPFSDGVYSALEFLENFEIPLLKIKSRKSTNFQLNPEEKQLIRDLTVEKDEEFAFDQGQLLNTYQLTETGTGLAKYFWEHYLNESQKNIFKRVFINYGMLTLKDLLRYVYKKYPDFTTRSEIIDSLNIH